MTHCFFLKLYFFKPIFFISNNPFPLQVEFGDTLGAPVCEVDLHKGKLNHCFMPKHDETEIFAGLLSAARATSKKIVGFTATVTEGALGFKF